MKTPTILRRHSTFKALAFGSATLLFALAAQAGPERGGAPAAYPSVVVRYSDLDLDSAAGNQALYARLTSAARRACGNETNHAELRRWQDYQSCVQYALDTAVRKIDSERLQALHAERQKTRSVG